VKLGFADFEGTISDSIKLASEQAGLGDDFELFEIPKERRSFFEMLSGGSEDVDDLNGLASGIAQKLGLTNLMSENSLRALLKLDTLNQPMLLMPGYWGKTDNR
jgi:protease-4